SRWSARRRKTDKVECVQPLLCGVPFVRCGVPFAENGVENGNHEQDGANQSRYQPRHEPEPSDDNADRLQLIGIVRSQPADRAEASEKRARDPSDEDQQTLYKRRAKKTAHASLSCLPAEQLLEYRDRDQNAADERHDEADVERRDADKAEIRRAIVRKCRDTAQATSQSEGESAEDYEQPVAKRWTQK